MIADKAALEKAQWKAKSEELEADQVAVSSKYKPAVAGGPGKPADYIQYIQKRAAQLNIHPLIVDQMIQKGIMPEFKGGTTPGGARMAIQARESAVIIPPDVQSQFGIGFKVLYSPRAGKDAGDTQALLQNGSQYIRNMERIKQIVGEGSWESLPSERKAEIETLATQNIYLIKPVVMKEALTVGERPQWEKLTGGRASEFFTQESSNLKNIDVDIQQTKLRMKNAIEGMTIEPTGYESPNLSPPKGAKPKK
jgi:hypothetical protein